MSVPISTTPTNPLGSNQNAASVVTLTLIFLGFSITFAGLTLLTHVSQILSLSFNSYALGCLGVLILALVFWFAILKNRLARISLHDSKVLVFVLIVGMLGSLVSLIAHRPDPDDYYYVPNAVYHLQNPGAGMDFSIHYLHGGAAPFESVVWDTSGAYEYVQAAAAYLLKIDFLTIYYVLSVAITGFMIPLALFLAISHFSNETIAAVVGTLLVFGVMLLLGDTHRTVGNFSFVRIFQGKIILFSIGIPIFAAFSIAYFRDRTFLSWIGLFSLATALTGMSSSVIFILPELAIVLAIAYLYIAGDRLRALKGLLPYFLSFIYVAVYALYALLHRSFSLLDSSSPVNQGWPTDFWGQANFYINPMIPLTPLVLIGATLLSLLLIGQERRRFLLAWVIAAVGLFLNPIVIPIMIRYIVPTAVYWRMFFIYPFPLVVGIAMSAAFSRMSQLPANAKFTITSLACLILIGANFLSPTSIFPNLRLALPYEKLPTYSFEQAKAIVAVAPPGVMLAPEPIGGIVVMLDSRFPQIRVGQSAAVWLKYQGRQNEADLRPAASDYLGGLNHNVSSLRDLLSQYGSDIRSVIILQSVFLGNTDLRNIFILNHFVHEQSVGGYMIVWR